MRGRAVAALGAVFAVSAALSLLLVPPPEPEPEPQPKERFPNILLRTQHGKAVRFYDDLVKDRAVAINLMYTGCSDLCPATTAALADLHERLGPAMGRDVTLLSISIDPAGDDPANLKRYWEAFGARPAWLFLSGEAADVARLRRALGLYDRDPVVDADLSQHAGSLVIGNDRSNRWLTLPALMHGGELARAVHAVATAPVGDAQRGRADYQTYCASCHGARGDGDGPLSRLLDPKPMRHSDARAMEALSDGYLARLLKEGGGAVGKSPLMAPWGKTFSDERIVDLVAHLRTLAYKQTRSEK